MFKSYQYFKFLFVFHFLLLSSVHASDILDDITIRGFGTLGGSYNDNDKTQYRDTVLSNKYSSGNFSFATDTKFGLQLDTTVNDKLSITLQGLVRQLDDTGVDVSLEWANVKYLFDDTLSMRLGRMRSPFFMYSDIMNVSYAYPWVKLPNEVYGSIPTTSFNGIELNKAINFDNYLLNAKFIYGEESKDLYMGNEAGGKTSELEMKNLYGVVLSSSIGNFSARTSYIRGKLSIDNPLMDDLATALKVFVSEDIGSDYEIKNETSSFYGLGFSYDEKNLFVIGEYTFIDSGPLIGKIRGFYLSGGYRFGKFTPYALIGRSDVANLYPETRIPAGELLDAANEAAKGINATQKSYSLGLKYELSENININAQYQRIDVDDKHLTIFVREDSNTDDLNVFSLTFNYVF